MSFSSKNSYHVEICSAEYLRFTRSTDVSASVVKVLNRGCRGRIEGQPQTSLATKHNH